MSVTTIVFIVILAFFTWRGYQKGFVGAITKVLSFLIAYPAAIFFTKPFATILRAHTGLDGLILFLVAGCSIFFVVSLLVTLLLNYVSSLVPSNEFTETGSKWGGAAFGIIFGGVIGLIAVYVIDVVAKPTSSQQVIDDGLQRDPVSAQHEEADSIRKYVVAGGEPTNDSFIDSSAKKLISTAASTAVSLITADKAATQITKTITQDPQAMLNHVQNNVERVQYYNDLELEAASTLPSDPGAEWPTKG
ncbi:MAG: CvpA family protein, partial [Moraxellaceae bacterium]